MRRREFVAGLAGAAAWPLGVSSGQQITPVVGFLRSVSFANVPHFVNALRAGLREVGFHDGRNVVLELRSAEDRRDTLPAIVAELIQKRVAVIVGDTNSTRAAKAGTTTVPIVFATGGDPVRDGLVTNLNRPEENVTGVVFFNGLLGAKRLELLRQLVPNPTTMGLLVSPNNPNNEAERLDVEATAHAVGQRLVTREVSSEREFDDAFALFVQHGVGALIVGSGAFLNSKRKEVIALAARHALPTSYAWREAAVAGGLMSYGASQSDAYHQAGIYAGRLLKGEKPLDLPVVRSNRLEFVINVRTARSLSLDIPPSLLARADEVVE